MSTITAEQAAQIEESTRGQIHSKHWRECRLHHLTSSNFGTICKSTERRDMDLLAEKLITYRDIRSKSILHGRKYESVAVEKFEVKWKMKTEQCGLFISQEHPQLAASPDRLVDSDTLLEIKCPYTSRDEKISSVTVPYLKTTGDGSLTLDNKHDYYYQIQGQLYCTNRKVCFFVVYTFKDLIMIKVHRNEKFIEDMCEKLLLFYKTHFKPALINKFVYKNYHDYKFE